MIDFEFLAVTNAGAKNRFSCEVMAKTYLVFIKGDE